MGGDTEVEGVLGAKAGWNETWFAEEVVKSAEGLVCCTRVRPFLFTCFAPLVEVWSLHWLQYLMEERKGVKRMREVCIARAIVIPNNDGGPLN